MTMINDGTGGGKSAKVTNDNRLNVSARSNTRSYYVSREDGQTFNWSSVIASVAAGEEVAYLQNTSDSKKLYIDTIGLTSANDVQWEISVATGTPGGASLVAGVNLNFDSGNVAAAAFYGDAVVTGLTAGERILPTRSLGGSNSSNAIDDVLILGQNDTIMITYIAGTTGAAEAVIRGFFE